MLFPAWLELFLLSELPPRGTCEELDDLGSSKKTAAPSNCPSCCVGLKSINERGTCGL